MRSNPSYLTILNNAAITNDNKINFLLFTKKAAIADTPKNKYNGSVNPKIEFSISDGSNTKNVTTISECDFEKNLLPK
tara:strand:+ start:1267 stop:1500 length:234 start_codon:yes stop_codon:yes gene_type:complete